MSTTTPVPPAKVTFGVPSLLFKETPQIATTIATVCLYLAAVINAAFLFFPQIPTQVKLTVGEYSASAVGFIHFLCNLFGLNPINPPTVAAETNSSSMAAKSIIIFLICSSIVGPLSAQSIFKPIPKPVTHSLNQFSRATVATTNGDSVFTGFRLTGLTVLYGISNGYTASNVYAGTGFGYEHDTYSSTTQRWSTDYQIGAGFYAGGHIAPGNLQAATAVGLHVALLNKQLILGILYNLNSPAGMTSHFVGAIGGNAYLVPTN